MNNLFCIDPGNFESGCCLIENGVISFGKTLLNEELITELLNIKERINDVSVLIEDITPYSVKMSTDVVDTCKFIGELCYRLKIASVDFLMIPRWKVKEWVFKRHYDLVTPEINQRIITNDLRYKNGEYRQASFVFVNDRNVLNAMKSHWGIEKPKPGKKNPLGLNGHSWQALAIGSYYMDLANS